MKILPLLLVLLAISMAVFAQAPAALSGTRTFTTPAANTAQHRYFDALQTARTTYAAELEPAIKSVLAKGALDDANVINDLKKQLLAGAMPAIPGADLKVSAGNSARDRFERTVAVAQRQYATELQPPLKAAMAAGQLDEANAISLELKGLSVVAAAPAVAIAAKPPVGVTSKPLAPGVQFTRYPLHDSQKDGSAYGGYVPYTELGKPLGASHTIKSISKWEKELEENAVVSGFIRIDKPGSYDFKSESGYDRNELLIDGKIVCKFRDGEKTIATVELTAGLHQIVSVAYAHATKEVRVTWKPPGAAALTDIPNNILFR